MSFILDALKKAESERSRHSGPVLMDVRIAPSRQRLPLWAWALGFVLVANLLLLGWVVFHKPRTAAPVAASAATPAPVAPAPAVVTPAPAAMPPATPAVMQPLPDVAPPTAPLPAPAPIAMPAPPPADILPTYQEVLASGAVLPQLQLVLHVYDEVPANRYVLLNSRRLREGEELSDGIRVERITSRGVVLDARGRRFLLLTGG